MKKIKKTTQNWLNTSKYDFETASDMLESKRYVYVIFMCHLAIEKMLKAIISHRLEIVPPYSHNLKRLAQLGKIKFPPAIDEFINNINLKSVPTRYPEDLTKMHKELCFEIAKSYLDQTKKGLIWLKQELRQKN